MSKLIKTTYKVCSENMDKFEKRMKSLQRKAIKLELNPIQYDVVDEVFEKHNDEIYKFYIVEFTYSEVPIINGWSFAGTIKHMGIGNIINKMPNFEKEIPDRFREVSTVCEHCNTNRFRNNTYIIFNSETNEFKQVGKSCLKDFTGSKSIEDIANYYEKVFEAIESDEWADVSSMGRIVPSYSEVNEWLAMTKEIVDRIGYVSVKKQQELAQYNEYKPLTKEEVYKHIFKNKIKNSEEIIVDKISENAKEYARMAIEYVRGLDAKTDYEKNLQVLIKDKYFSLDTAGYVTSIVPFYQIAMKKEEQQRERELTKEENKKSVMNSQHFGEIGKRMDLTLTVKQKFMYEGVYGVVVIHIMHDENKNVFVWKTTSKNLDENILYKIKATIKGHEVYDGINQTELTRCKVL